MAALVFTALMARAAADAQSFAAPLAELAAGGTSICSAGALDTVGDGCPATQATFLYGGIQAAWTDSFSNVYIADYSNERLRIVYHGGAGAAAIITANNPTVTAPQAGYIYSIGGNGTTAKFTATYCNGGAIGPKPSDGAGDGCPSAEVPIQPTGGAVDADGNVFFRDASSAAGTLIRVIYAGGEKAASLINIESGGAVTSPTVGSVYLVSGSVTGSGYSASGNGVLATTTPLNNSHSITVDGDDNIYIADTGNNQVREIVASTGHIRLVAGGGGSNSNSSGGITSAVAATLATLNGPYDIALDANNNVFIADSGNLVVRMVYSGGTVFGSSNYTAGNIYTVAGGGTASTSGSAATTINFSAPRGVSFDGFGNFYITDEFANRIWQVTAANGTAVIFAGGGGTYTAGSPCTSSVTAGPKASDYNGDGCPAPLIKLGNPFTKLAFDPSNNSYVAEYKDSPGGGTTYTMIRGFTFNDRFADTAVGSPAADLFVAQYYYATSTSVPSISTVMEGGTTTEFTAKSVNCTGTSISSGTTCYYDLGFAPAVLGIRPGAYELENGSSALATGNVSGVGLDPLLAFSSGTQNSFAESFVTEPQSVSADTRGNVYISDAGENALWKGAAGGSTFTQVASGLSNPWQSGEDGLGNVYIADAGNNRIAKLDPAGTLSTFLGSLSGPKGVAVAGDGTVYVADTGNNRILRVGTGGMTQVVSLATLGTGLSSPSALALDAEGDLFIADAGNNRIVEVRASGQESVLSVSQAITPAGLATDPAGDLYIADSASGTEWELPQGSSDLTPISTNLSSVGGIALDESGNLYYTQSSVAGIEKVATASASLAFATTGVGATSADQTFSVHNIGNVVLAFSGSPVYLANGDTGNFTILTNGCASTLPVGASCSIDAEFSPATAQTSVETLTFPSNAGNASSASATLTGSTPVEYSSTTTLATSTASPIVNAPVTLTATVAGQPGTSPTGTVTFLAIPAGGTQQTLGIVNATVSGGANAVATYSWSPTAAGSYSLTAQYSGDSNYKSSTASAVQITVLQPDFAISAETGTLSVQNGSSTSSDALTITAFNSFSGTVTFSCSGLPSGAQCNFSPSTVAGAGQTSLTIATVKAETVGAPAQNAAGKAKLLGIGGGVALNILFWCVFPRKRRRWALNLFVMAVTTALLCNGCGGSVGPSASTTVALQALTNTPVKGVMDTVTAAIAPSTATGTVQFTLNGAAAGSPAAVIGGAATYPAIFTSGGSYQIGAAYSGDSHNAPSTAPALTLTVPYTTGSIPGSYTLTVTATSSALSHSTTIGLTVQ